MDGGDIGSPIENPRELWDRIVTDFMRMSDAPVRVEIHDYPLNEVVEGISEAMHRLGTEGYAVVLKDDQVWIIEDAAEVMRRRATVDLLVEDPEDKPPQDVN